MRCIFIVVVLLFSLVRSQNIDSYGLRQSEYNGYEHAVIPPDTYRTTQVDDNDKMRHFFKFWKKGPFRHHWHHPHIHHHDTEYIPPVPSPPVYHPTNYMQPIIPPTYQHAQPILPPSAYHHEHPPIVQPPIQYNIYQHPKTMHPMPMYHGRRSEFDVPLGSENPSEPMPTQYPSNAELKCGSNELLGCAPVVRAVPCYDYHQYPSYHAPVYSSYHAPAYQNYHAPVYPNYQVPVYPRYNARPAPPPLPSPPQPQPLMDVHSKAGPPYEAVNLQLARQYIRRQNDTETTNQTTVAVAETIATTTLKTNSSVEQTTENVQITTTDRPKLTEKYPLGTSKSRSLAKPITESPSSDKNEFDMEQMPADVVTVNPEQQKLMDEEREAHLQRVQKFRIEADHKIQQAIERSNNGASDEFDDQSSEFQSNKI